jgi:hypothetical protein
LNEPGVLGDGGQVFAGSQVHELEVGRGSEPRDAAFTGRCEGKKSGAVGVDGEVSEERLGDGSVVIAGGVKVRVGIICSGVEATTAPVSVRWERFKGTDVVLG